MPPRLPSCRLRWIYAALVGLVVSGCAANGASSPSVAGVGMSSGPVASTRVSGVAAGSSAQSSAVTVAPMTRQVKSADEGADRLTGTEWLLTSITTAGGTIPVPAAMDAVLRLDGSGALSINDGCNDFGASVVISADHLQIGSGGSTDVACGGYPEIRAVFPYQLTGSVDWAVRNGTLVLTTARGTSLSFTVRPSIYRSDGPGAKVRVLAEGKRGTARYRFYETPGKSGVGVGIEVQQKPGASWGSAGQYREFSDKLYPADPGDASGVKIGPDDFLFLISDDRTARVTITPAGGAPITVHRYTSRERQHFTVFGSFVGAQNRQAVIRLYDHQGKVIGKPYLWRW